VAHGGEELALRPAGRFGGERHLVGPLDRPLQLGVGARKLATGRSRQRLSLAPLVLPHSLHHLTAQDLQRLHLSAAQLPGHLALD